MVVKKLDNLERQVVFVVDDHPIVSFGLVEMVKDVAPHARIRQFSTLKEAARHAVAEFPALIISDFHLRDVQADTFIGLFETLFPSIPVLITANDDKVMAQLKRHQIDRFIAFSKFTPFPKLIDLIRIGLAQANIDLMEIPKVSRSLTSKQVEVLELIGAGHSNKDIAELLSISVETVKGHVKEILERLKAKNRMEASIIYRHTQIRKNSRAEPSLHNN
ncbi:response regulator transcription factor [Limnobacter parvus]|uniref:Response regulator transcription factor n=1 Tax=Limnobacter parvus TaxID=2939690 RepID=A0ABT1XEP6_9BURK|nr:response regulator transcription factor [Limnobacter parvus]MCR2745725.1 response regulator transcription factor [Limnobacter parvus]